MVRAISKKSSHLKTIRTRFAPSPTGFLHVGGVRAALFSYIFAKQHGGNFVLRIEDTDRERWKPEYEEDILDNLKWVGLEWDEGPDIGGKYGPYRQSERKEIYKKYLQQLLKEKRAYYCFCTQEELEAKRQYQISQGITPYYDGKCSVLSEKEVEKNLAEGKKSVIRIKNPQKPIEFKDLIRGQIKFESDLLGDFVIAKGLEQPLFYLAGVIDDFEMKTTHVLRGEEHLPNTPKQIIIQEALNFSQPLYGHLPLILDEDRSKMSKRYGSTSINEYKKQGYLPEAMINFLAFLGWNPGDEREIYSLQNLIKDFSLEKVHKGGGVFNIKKLDYLNGFYIRQKSINKLTELCVPYLVEAGLVAPIFEEQERLPDLTGFFGKEIVQKNFLTKANEKISFDYLKKIIAIYQERLKKLSEITELTNFFFKGKLEYPKELLRWKKMGDKEVLLVIDKLIEVLSRIKEKDWNSKKIEKILLLEAETTAKELSVAGDAGDRGYLLWPLRAGLSGQKSSAGPFDIAEILGREKTLKRLEETKNIIKK